MPSSPRTHRRTRLVVAALVALALLPVGGERAAAQADPEIIGGTRADPGEYPFQVALLQHAVADRWSAQFCGGTLIAPDTVLTAGHCVIGYRATDIDVLAGTNRLQPGGGQRVPARAIRLHPGYDDSTLENDLAIIQLPVDLPYATVTPAAAGDEARYPAGTTATTIGWGDRDRRPGQQQYPVFLREVEVPVVSDDDCVAAYDGEVFAEVSVCAGDTVDGGEDSCYGDSGGPLLVPDGDDWLQIGIVSTGLGCARQNYPGIYAEVAAFDDLVGRFLGPDTAPDRVTDLRRRPVAPNAVRLSWRPPFFDGGTRITQYRIDVPGLGRAHAVVGTQTHFRLRNLPPGTHRVRVRAVNVVGASAFRDLDVVNPTP